MVKKIELILLSVALTALTACGDFLEESSQDEVRPSTVSDLQQLLLGEGYLLTSPLTPYLELLTDNVENFYTDSPNQQAYVKAGQWPFTWEPELINRLKEQDVAYYNTWANAYSYIKGCNVVLDMIDEATGSEAERANVKGQALALRAYYYFVLVNLFAKPYNAPAIDREAEPGVPLILKSEVTDDYPARNSLADVYRQIEADLLAAEPLMERYGTENIKDKVTAQFVNHLLCRLYLYEERYDDCIRQADIVLQRQPGLLQIARYNSRNSSGFYTMHVYHPDSPELIWCYSSDSDNSSFQGVCNGEDIPAFTVSKSLKELYDYRRTAKSNKGDARGGFFYTYYNVGSMTWDPATMTLVQQTELYWGCHNYNSGDANKGFRTAEDYLNRAECYIRKFRLTGNDAFRKAALDDLNTLRRSRWDGTYKEIDMDSADELWQFYLDERRRELAFDDHRWYDLRRLGMPRLVHTFTLTKGQPQEYVLAEGDGRYVLQIPQETLDRNPALIQNPR